MTCTWSTLSILPSEPRSRPAPQVHYQAPRWITFRAANGSLSERRAHVQLRRDSLREQETRLPMYRNSLAIQTRWLAQPKLAEGERRLACKDEARRLVGSAKSGGGGIR